MIISDAGNRIEMKQMGIMSYMVNIWDSWPFGYICSSSYITLLLICLTVSFGGNGYSEFDIKFVQ